MAGGGLHRHPDRGDRGPLRDDLDAAARPGDLFRGSCRDPRRTRRLLDDPIPAGDDDEQHGLRPPAGGLRTARIPSRLCSLRDPQRDLRHLDQRIDQRGRRQLLAILGERHVRDRRRGPRGLARRRRGPVDVLRSSGGMMPRGWRAAVDAGLGDNRTRILGVFLILLAILGTYVMRAYANIETGEWAFLTRPLGVPFATMLEAQVPFTLYHLLSSLIFVPLLGAAFLFLHAYGWPTRSPEEATSRPLGRG